MYSMHIRKKILSIKEKETLSFVKIGKRFGISLNTIFQWTKRLKPKIKREKRAIKIDTKQEKIKERKKSKTKQR